MINLPKFWKAKYVKVISLEEYLLVYVFLSLFYFILLCDNLFIQGVLLNRFSWIYNDYVLHSHDISCLYDISHFHGMNVVPTFQVHSASHVQWYGEFRKMWLIWTIFYDVGQNFRIWFKFMICLSFLISFSFRN